MGCAIWDTNLLNNFLMDFFGLCSMRSEISNTFFSVSIDGLPDLVVSHMEPVSLNFWINCRTALRCGTLVSGNCAWNRCWTFCVYSPPHRNTCFTRNVHSSTDNTIITAHTFLASLLGSIWLLGSRLPGPGGQQTHTNAICYLILCYHGRWLKLFKILYFCVFFVL